MSPTLDQGATSTGQHVGDTAFQIQQRLTERLTPTQLEVLDESAAHAGHAGAGPTNSGTHFRIRIASPLFTGQTRIARHRLVYDSIQELIDQGVHAIAIEVVSPTPPVSPLPRSAAI